MDGGEEFASVPKGDAAGECDEVERGKRSRGGERWAP
jgi:hypothetical protein